MIGHLKIAAALAALILVAPVAAHDMSMSIEKARPGVVAVLPVWAGRAPNLEEPEGSGVVLGDGRFVLTAAHVIGRAEAIRVRTADGAVVDAGLLAADAFSDLALLQLDLPLPALTLAGDPDVGDEVCAVGNAFGLGVSATCGVVSATRKSGVGFNAVEDFIQTDAAVNPGASGGALVDAEGKVVGILSAIFTKQSDANIGVNFAVSAPLARRVFEDLRDNGKVAWPQPDIVLRAFPGAGETGRAGALITSVRPNGLSAEAGIETGDVLLRIGDRPIRSAADYVGAIVRDRPPFTTTVTLVRDGKAHELELTFPAADK